MQIGDIVNIKIEEVAKGPNAAQRQKRIEEGAFIRDIPTKGIVEEMYEKFVLLAMINSGKQKLYRSCYYYDQVYMDGEGNV